MAALRIDDQGTGPFGAVVFDKLLVEGVGDLLQVRRDDLEIHR